MYIYIYIDLAITLRRSSVEFCVGPQRSVSGPGALFIRHRSSVCRAPALSLCGAPALNHSQLTKSAALQVCLLTIEFSDYDVKYFYRNFLAKLHCKTPQSVSARRCLCRTLCRALALYVSGSASGPGGLCVGPRRYLALCWGPALSVSGPGALSVGPRRSHWVREPPPIPIYSPRAPSSDLLATTGPRAPATHPSDPACHHATHPVPRATSLPILSAAPSRPASPSSDPRATHPGRGPPAPIGVPGPPAQIRVPPIQPAGAFPLSRRESGTLLLQSQ